MIRVIRVLSILLALLVANMPTLHAKQKTFTVAFGSCAKHYLPQPIWNDIAKHKPDLFLFIGDNQYADTRFENGRRIYGPVSDPEQFTYAYNAVKQIPEFIAFTEQVPKIMGTWDDHDYGVNDGGKEYPLKEASQQAFIEFFGFPKKHPIREQEGVYHTEIFESSGNKVQVIMLDTRYHRDNLIKNPNGRPQGKGPYIPQTDLTTSMLGQTQWQWLKEQLSIEADVRLIVSSIQVIAHQHGWESWGTMPHQRQALYDLIQDTKANGVFFLSGDRHLMEISKDVGQLGNAVPYSMWDFTSSGMTDAFREVLEHNDFRVGPVVRDTNYGVVSIHWNEQNILNTIIEFEAFSFNQRPLAKTQFLLNDLKLLNKD